MENDLEELQDRFSALLDCESIAKYRFKTLQGLLDDLQKEIQQQKDGLTPKKRFQFSSKKSSSSRSPDPPLPSSVPSPSDTVISLGMIPESVVSSVIQKRDEGVITVSDRSSIRVILLPSPTFLETPEKPRFAKQDSSLPPRKVLLARLKDCLIFQPFSDSPFGQITIRSASDSVFILPAVSGSVFIEDCSNCVFVFASHQVCIEDIMNLSSHIVDPSLFSLSMPETDQDPYNHQQSICIDEQIKACD